MRDLGEKYFPKESCYRLVVALLLSCLSAGRQVVTVVRTLQDALVLRLQTSNWHIAVVFCVIIKSTYSAKDDSVALFVMSFYVTVHVCDCSCMNNDFSARISRWSLTCIFYSSS